MRDKLDTIDMMRISGDIDGLRTAQLEAWGEWRAVMHTIRADGTSRDMYRAGYRIETRIDRLERAVGWLSQ